MTKDQFLGQIRAILTAAGSALATWGLDDGNAWAPIVGIILALVSCTWGLLHHRDPATPGVVSWSAVRKLLNLIGSAAVTYGFLNPEKVGSIEAVAAALDLPGGLPRNTAVPAITGTAAVDAVITSSTGTWSGTPTSYAYQWTQNGADVGGGLPPQITQWSVETPENVSPAALRQPMRAVMRR